MDNLLTSSAENETPDSVNSDNQPSIKSEQESNMKKNRSGKKFNFLPEKFYNPYAVISLRIIVGLLFIISGFAKAIDPWGFIFKIEDYLTAWGMAEPRTITLVVAIAISTYEFILGFMTLTGCLKRWAPRLLMLSMIVMLPLTAYIWISHPVDDCGCFGELWKISNAATFWKNVFITVALLYLCQFNSRERRGIYRPAIQWIVVTVVLLYSIIISLYGYNFQPMLDFRPYPVGTNLYSVLTGEAINDSHDIKMVYRREGKEQEFSIDNLPDSTWTFVRRVDSEVEANSNSDSGFSILDVDYDDVTDIAINNEGEMLILVIPEANRVDIAYTYATNEMNKAINRSGGSMIALLAADSEVIERWLDVSMADYPCYIVEDTALKQLSRGGMSMVYLRDGIIEWKRALSAFDFSKIDALGNDTLSISSIEIDDRNNFYVITAIALAILLIIALTQEFILRLLPKRQKKQLNLQSENQDDKNLD